MFVVYVIDCVIYDDAIAHIPSVCKSIRYEASLFKTFTIMSCYPVHLSQGSR